MQSSQHSLIDFISYAPCQQQQQQQQQQPSTATIAVLPRSDGWAASAAATISAATSCADGDLQRAHCMTGMCSAIAEARESWHHCKLPGVQHPSYRLCLPPLPRPAGGGVLEAYWVALALVARGFSRCRPADVLQAAALLVDLQNRTAFHLLTSISMPPPNAGSSRPAGASASVGFMAPGAPLAGPSPPLGRENDSDSGGQMSPGDGASTASSSGSAISDPVKGASAEADASGALPAGPSPSPSLSRPLPAPPPTTVAGTDVPSDLKLDRAMCALLLGDVASAVRLLRLQATSAWAKSGLGLGLGGAVAVSSADEAIAQFVLDHCPAITGSKGRDVEAVTASAAAPEGDDGAAAAAAAAAAAPGLPAAAPTTAASASANASGSSAARLLLHQLKQRGGEKEGGREGEREREAKLLPGLLCLLEVWLREEVCRRFRDTAGRTVALEEYFDSLAFREYLSEGGGKRGGQGRGGWWGEADKERARSSGQAARASDGNKGRGGQGGVIQWLSQLMPQTQEEGVRRGAKSEGVVGAGGPSFMSSATSNLLQRVRGLGDAMVSEAEGSSRVGGAAAAHLTPSGSALGAGRSAVSASGAPAIAAEEAAPGSTGGGTAVGVAAPLTSITTGGSADVARSRSLRDIFGRSQQQPPSTPSQGSSALLGRPAASPTNTNTNSTDAPTNSATALAATPAAPDAAPAPAAAASASLRGGPALRGGWQAVKGVSPAGQEINKERGGPARLPGKCGQVAQLVHV